MKTQFTTDEMYGIAYLANYFLMNKKETDFTEEREIVKRLFSFLKETEEYTEEYTIIANN